MKTPVNVIEDITAQIIEGKTLLESIYRESDENEKTDCYTACLLRSLEKTIDNARAYVTQFSKNYKHYKPTAPTGYTPNNLGNRIQIAREKLGLSEVDLAEKLDIHPGYVLTWEDGTDQPLAGMIIPLANALRCDPMWLLTGKSHHEPVAHTVMPSSPVEVMQNVDVSTIGKRIGVARVANHMNTQELEEAIGAPDGTVFRWETGKAIPSSQYIDILARTLNVSVTWLLTGREMETSHA
ncbi:helix-turn-helix domain-containing protein [Salmonella enterica]|nr:helix-turn-helix domain-containing protein [Salmonella enterica]EKC2509790.1 helix-turn-helix domain-containing protein [Salmonella enterica]EKC3257549.1 helix-turn-helix domain-containing protein [Salmonella enterica]ELG6864417.1 helix-turn-helix domain-containing protein [Salmonella enterica]ELH8365235.1 helix-turn-helix domain-containing protein [Salmonella enterica]